MNFSKDNWALRNIADKLKPTICESCKAEAAAEGNTCCEEGFCEHCLRNIADNKEYVMTHLFRVNSRIEGYHDRGDGHKDFKGMKYRLANERPLLYYGIELEIGFNYDYARADYDDYYQDEYGEDCCDLSDIVEEFDRITGGIFIYETDSTVENGVECISRPMSYAAWTSDEVVGKVKEGLEYLERMGAWDPQPEGHGMHVHISRAFFDNAQNERTQREMYADFDWLFQYYQKELEILGGREYTDYCASKVDKVKRRYDIGTRDAYDNTYNVELKVTGKLKKGGSLESGHDSAIIISGPTLEGRIFHSTLNYKEVLANIEIMRNFAHAVRESNIEGKTLNNILHTKDNLYLDEVIREKRNLMHKIGKSLTLTRKNTSEIELKGEE